MVLLSSSPPNLATQVYEPESSSVVARIERVKERPSLDVMDLWKINEKR